jgi:transposase
MQKQCTGIDISKADFSAVICKRSDNDDLSYSNNRKFSNDKKGFNQLTKWAAKESKKGVPMVFLIEATGVYHENLTNHLHKIGKTVHVILPNTSKNYFRSLNIKTKTDDVDARILSRFGVERKHREWQPPNKIYKEMRDLSRYRIQLQEQKTALANIAHSKEYSHDISADIIKSNKKLIKLLDKEIDAVKAKLAALVATDENLSERIRKICTIKGLALQSAAGLIAETNGFEGFVNGKQLASFAGYDVVHNESGTSVKGKTRISKKGNRYIRHLMYHPGMSASQYVPEFANLRDRIFKRTWIPMKAQCAVQRKLLLLIYTLWKNETEYQPEYHEKKIARAKAQATQDKLTSEFSLRQ